MPLTHDASIRAARVTRTVERMTRNLPGHRGRWHKGGGDRIVAFTLTEDMDATTDGEASVTMHKTWDATTEAYTGSEAGVVLSIGGAFDDALSGAYGEGRIRPGNGRQIIDPIWIAC